jgi:hypothetical protein
MIKTFLIHYVNSADSVNETTIKASDATEARRKLKQRLGKACYRIINVRELEFESIDLNMVGNTISTFNELDKLYEEQTTLLIESKADTQNLIDFAGAELAARFFNIKNKLKAPENDLYYWIKNKTASDLEQTITSIENTKSNTLLRKETAEQGAELVCESDHWKVYHITTYEAAQTYGRDTHWCITGINEWGDKYWKEYKEKGVDFYFFITKGEYNPRGYDSKYALAIYPDKKSYEAFDQKDGQILLEDIRHIYEVQIPGINLDTLQGRGDYCCRCGDFVPDYAGYRNAFGCYCDACFDDLFN